MGCDAYHPFARRGSNLTYAGGIGYMVLDAIDSLILLGLDEEYQRAREWVATELSFDRDGVYNTFEVSTRWTDHTIIRRATAAHGHFPDDYSCIGWTAVRIRAVWT